MSNKRRVHTRLERQRVEEEATSQSQASRVPESIQETLASQGQELDSEARAFMEPRFGHDFSKVRIHADERAAESARAVNALAYTVGHDVVFDSGQYAPGTTAGKHLLAHELTHVLQQNQSAGSSQSLTLGDPASASETEAWASARAVTAHQPVAQIAATQPATTIQRATATEILEEAEDSSPDAEPAPTSTEILEEAEDSSPDAEPAPASSKHGSSSKSRFEAMKPILEKSQTGREALKIKNDYKVGSKYHKSGGSYWDHTSRSMMLDTTENVTESALTFVHEINHAKYDLTGKSADVHALSRDDYVKQMVAEEAEGTVKSIEAQEELHEAKVNVSHASFPLASQYQQAYKDAVKNAKASNPHISAAELRQMGRDAGKARVTKGFMDGEVVTSNTQEKYPDYYGKYWDAVHTHAH